MKVLGILFLAVAVTARPELRRESQEGSQEDSHSAQDSSASLPSRGAQPIFFYLPEYGLVGERRPPIQRPSPSDGLYHQQVKLGGSPQQAFPPVFRPQPIYRQTVPLLLPLPLPQTLPQHIPYDLDVSDWISGLEESIRADEDSVVLAASDSKRTSLLLRPVAKAVAGPRGVAVASPVAKAVLRKGQPVSIDFDPDAVAIAGPGGSAEAHPKLVISYVTESPTVATTRAEGGGQTSTPRADDSSDEPDRPTFRQ